MTHTPPTYTRTNGGNQSAHGLPWKIQAVVAAAKASFPLVDQLRQWKHRICPCGISQTEPGVIEQAARIKAWFDSAGIKASGATVVEIGTGWHPIIPLFFSIARVERVHLFDQVPLCTQNSLWAAVNTVKNNRRQILDALGCDERNFSVIDKLDHSWRLEDVLDAVRLNYNAPHDCRHLPLLDGSVDMLFSRAVLEHVNPKLLPGICTDALRCLKPSGAAFHIIDNSDHWQHVDPRISRVNFLKYSDTAFSLTGINPQNYQNRLRHPEYREAFKDAGFILALDESDVHEPSLKALREMRLAERFQRFTDVELATTTSCFGLRPPTLA